MRPAASCRFLTAMLIGAGVTGVTIVWAADAPWSVPRSLDAPLGAAPGIALTGTEVAPPFSPYGAAATQVAWDLGPADRSSLIRADLGVGFGLPAGFQIALGLPLATSFAARLPDGATAQTDDGPGLGDLRVAAMLNLLSVRRSALGLLLGAELGFPTGDHDALLGEGGFSGLPYVALATSVLGLTVSLEVGWLLRPEHRSILAAGVREQDDDLIYRFGLAVPRKDDLVWRFEIEGAIGVATAAGPWPDSDNRPVTLRAGLGFPVSRTVSLLLHAGGELAGDRGAGFVGGLRIANRPTAPDEDGDTVTDDLCPLIPEDLDGFEDADGCPDLDNDHDGFPDDEDRCPTAPGAASSEDGC